MPWNGSWHALFPYRKEAFLPSSPFSFLFSSMREPTRELSLEKLPRSDIHSGDTWIFKSGTSPGEPSEFYRGGLLDLTMSSVTGEFLSPLKRFKREVYIFCCYFFLNFLKLLFYFLFNSQLRSCIIFLYPPENLI